MKVVALDSTDTTFHIREFSTLRIDNFYLNSSNSKRNLSISPWKKLFQDIKDTFNLSGINNSES